MAAHLGFHDHDQAIRADASVAIENFAREGGKTGGKVALEGDEPIIPLTVVFNERNYLCQVTPPKRSA